MSPRKYALVAAVLFVLWSSSLRATPTGLNNIPTADVVDPQVLVLQQISNFGPKQQAVFTAGFKYGLVPRVEIGYDGRFASANSGEANSGQQTANKLRLDSAATTGLNSRCR